ncbi:MAG: hypothetical protein ACKERG_00510 [Candidatus Hodgkinia cicadicola]
MKLRVYCSAAAVELYALALTALYARRPAQWWMCRLRLGGRCGRVGVEEEVRVREYEGKLWRKGPKGWRFGGWGVKRRERRGW